MRTRTGLALVALALVVGGLALLPEDPAPRPSDDRGELSGRTSDDQPRQTSDGLPGEIAEPLPPGPSPRPQVSRERSWRIAPGVTYRRFDEADRRGRYRVHVVRVDPSEPGVRLDYASMATVPRRGPLTRLLGRDDAVAGVNGGFFDIYDTGAPLGVGRDLDRGFLHAAKYTWTNALTTSASGRMRIGPVTMRAGIAEHPEIEITNVNSPRVREGKVGLYTSAWGKTPATRSPTARSATSAWCRSTTAGSRPARPASTPARRSPAASSSAAGRAPTSWPTCGSGRGRP